MYNPLITHIVLSETYKARLKETELAQYWRPRAGDGTPQSASKKYRALVGIGSITLGALMIVQTFLS